MPRHICYNGPGCGCSRESGCWPRSRGKSERNEWKDRALDAEAKLAKVREWREKYGGYGETLDVLDDLLYGCLDVEE